MSELRTRRTTSYELLYLEHATSEPCHIWISSLGISKSEQLHMNLFTWATHSKQAHVSLTASFGTKSKGQKYCTRPRGGNTRLRSRISRVSFRRSVMSSCTISERALAKWLFGECATGLAHLILCGVGGGTFIMSKRVCLTYSRLPALARGR